MPRAIRPYVLRLSYLVGFHDTPSGWEKSAIRYTLQGKSLRCTHAGATPAADDYVLRQEVDIPPDDGSRPVRLGISIDSGSVKFVELMTVEYMLRPSPVPSSLSVARPLPAVRCPAPDVSVLHGAMFKDVRFLAGGGVGFETAVQDGGALVIVGLVNSEPLASPVRVHCRSASQAGYVDVQGNPGMAVVPLICAAGEDGVIGLWVEGDVPDTGLYAVRLDRRALRDAGIPLDLHVKDAALWPYLATGFTHQNHTPDGKPFCWTSERVALHLPVHGAPRDVEALMEVVGPPGPAGPLDVTMAVNGHDLPTLEVQPDAPTVLRWPVAAELLREGLNEVVFTVPTWQPSVVLGTADERALGVMFRGLTWR